MICRQQRLRSGVFLARHRSESTTSALSTTLEAISFYALSSQFYQYSYHNIWRTLYCLTCILKAMNRERFTRADSVMYLGIISRFRLTHPLTGSGDCNGRRCVRRKFRLLERQRWNKSVEVGSSAFNLGVVRLEAPARSIPNLEEGSNHH